MEAFPIREALAYRQVVGRSSHVWPWSKSAWIRLELTATALHGERLLGFYGELKN